MSKFQRPAVKAKRSKKAAWLNEPIAFLKLMIILAFYRGADTEPIVVHIWNIAMPKKRDERKEIADFSRL